MHIHPLNAKSIYTSAGKRVKFVHKNHVIAHNMLTALLFTIRLVSPAKTLGFLPEVEHVFKNTHSSLSEIRGP